MRLTATCRFRWIMVLCALCYAVAYAAPTETRSWKSTAGTAADARGTSLEDGVVTLETSTGRVIKLNTSLLVDADREFLNKHFGEKPATPAAPSKPPGQVLGPVESEGSSYYYFIPNSLKPGRNVPLLFVTNAGGGNANNLVNFQEGAEICSWIIAISVESKNGMSYEARELGSKPSSASYISGIVSLEKLTLDVIADGPKFLLDCLHHTNPEIQKAVDKFSQELADTPWIKEILPALKNKTGGA